jgi:hypothetical protein
MRHGQTFTIGLSLHTRFTRRIIIGSNWRGFNKKSTNRSLIKK